MYIWGAFQLSVLFLFAFVIPFHAYSGLNNSGGIRYNSLIESEKGETHIFQIIHVAVALSHSVEDRGLFLAR